jgi:pyrroloquinoline quinone biosynthesis protein E
MQEPCRSCSEKEQDFGGCRCQAFLLTGDAGNTDPACAKSPKHHLIAAAVTHAHAPTRTAVPLVLRRERNARDQLEVARDA